MYFGNKFVEEGLIDEQRKRNIITLGISDYDKADRLMTAAKAKIEQDPESFHRLIAIFGELAVFVPLVKQLKQIYNSECNACKVSTTQEGDHLATMKAFAFINGLRKARENCSLKTSL